MSAAEPAPAPPERRGDRAGRSLAKAVSWRLVGFVDTFTLSYLVLTWLAPLFGAGGASHAENAHTSSLIALTELITKIGLYFLHERAWSRLGWGLSDHPTRRELHRRSVAKTASWRIIAGIDTIVLALIFTGSLGTALSIGGFEAITKLALYFVHERAWARIGWGLHRGGA